MIILGFDPGVQRVGFAVIEVAAQLKVHEWGHWDLLKMAATRTVKRASIGARLECLHREASEVLTKWNPRWVGLEKAVSFRDISAAHTLSEARGVIRLAAHQVLASADERLIELSPTAVKKSASGFGLSSKAGVIKSMKFRFPGLNLKDEKIPHDAFDALAIAWATYSELKKFQPKNSLKKSFV